MSAESVVSLTYHFHYLYGAGWERTDIGSSTTILMLPDGSKLQFDSSKYSNPSDSDKTELVRQTQALYCVLLELTGEKHQFAKCRLFLRALQSATDSLFPHWNATAVSVRYNPAY